MIVRTVCGTGGVLAIVQWRQQLGASAQVAQIVANHPAWKRARKRGKEGDNVILITAALYAMEIAIPQTWKLGLRLAESELRQLIEGLHKEGIHVFIQGTVEWEGKCVSKQQVVNDLINSCIGAPARDCVHQAPGGKFSGEVLPMPNVQSCEGADTGVVAGNVFSAVVCFRQGTKATLGEKEARLGLFYFQVVTDRHGRKVMDLQRT